MNCLKKIYSFVLLTLKKIFGPDVAKKFDAYIRYKKRINLKKPITLAEKVCFLENHEHDELKVRCTDKWEVRSYVQSKGLENILVPVICGPFTSTKDFDLSTLPNQFIIKATHGCKMNLICTDKQNLDTQVVFSKLKKWLKESYGGYSCEWHYLKIPHRFYVEQLIQNDIVDYKIMCLNGKPHSILVCYDRLLDKNGHPRKELYDLEWNRIPCITDGSDEEKSFPKPENLSEMIDIAKILSSDFKFVRVDLYDVLGKIYFGELTFSPANGLFPYFSDDFLIETGKLLDIQNVN